MGLNDSVCRSDILDTVHCRNAKSVCSNWVVWHGRRAAVRSRRPACCGPILQPALAWCRVTDHLSVCAGHRSAARRWIACQYSSVWASDAPCAALRWLRAAYDHLIGDATLAARDPKEHDIGEKDLSGLRATDCRTRSQNRRTAL